MSENTKYPAEVVEHKENVFFAMKDNPTWSGQRLATCTYRDGELVEVHWKKEDRMSYKCCGCGAEWPDGKNLYCPCPTDVLYTPGTDDVGNLKSILIMDDNPKLASKLARGPRWLEATGEVLSALSDTKFIAGVAVGMAAVLFTIHFDLARDGRADWINGSIEYVEETK